VRLGYGSSPSDVRMFQSGLKESVLHQVLSWGQKNSYYERFGKPSLKMSPVRLRSQATINSQRVQAGSGDADSTTAFAATDALQSSFSG